MINTNHFTIYFHLFQSQRMICSFIFQCQYATNDVDIKDHTYSKGLLYNIKEQGSFYQNWNGRANFIMNSSIIAYMFILKLNIIHVFVKLQRDLLRPGNPLDITAHVYGMEFSIDLLES